MSWLGCAFPGLALGIAVMAAAGVVLAGPGYRFGWWGLGPAFTLLRSSAELGLGAGAVAVVAIVVGGAQRSRRRLGLGILALVIALAAFGIPWRMQAQARRVPPIHDVTTDPEDPPVFVAVVARRTGARNPVEYAGPAVAVQQRRAFPDLVPLDLTAPSERVFPRGRGGRAGPRLGDRGGGVGGGTARGDGHDALVRLQGRRRRARPRAGAGQPGRRPLALAGRRRGSRRQRRACPGVSRPPPGERPSPGLTPRDPVV